MYIYVLKYIPLCTCIYLVRIELVRTWIVLHLKHQDVLYCTWEVYTTSTCMIRQESNAPMIKKPSFLWNSIYRYTQCLFGIYRYIPVQVGCNHLYWYILVYTMMYQIVCSCPGVGDSRCHQQIELLL